MAQAPDASPNETQAQPVQGQSEAAEPQVVQGQPAQPQVQAVPVQAQPETQAPGAAETATPQPVAGLRRPDFIGEGKEQAEATEKRKIILHNGKVMIALQTALLKSPGANTPAPGWQDAIRRIAILYRDTLNEVMRSLGEEGQAQTKIRIDIPVAKMVGSIWSVDPELAEMRGAKGLAQTFLEWNRMLPSDDDKPTYGASSLSVEMEMALSQSGAFANLTPTLMQLDRLSAASRRLYLSDLSLDDFRDKLYDLMEAHAICLTDHLAPAGVTSDKGRLITFKSICRHVGQVIGAVVEAKHARITAEMKALPKDKRSEYLEAVNKMPEGRLMAECREGVCWALTGAYPAARDVITEFPGAKSEKSGATNTDFPSHAAR